MAHPFQEVYDLVFKTSQTLGYDTVQSLPDPDDGQDLKRAFVHVGEQFGEDIYNKSAIFGELTQSIHVFGPIENRLKVSSMMDSLIRKLREQNSTAHYYIRITQVKTQMIKDTSTAVTMWHGLLDVTFKIY